MEGRKGNFSISTLWDSLLVLLFICINSSDTVVVGEPVKFPNNSKLEGRMMKSGFHIILTDQDNGLKLKDEFD